MIIVNVQVANQVRISPWVGENILIICIKETKKKSTYTLRVIRPDESLPFSKSHEALRICNKRTLSLQNVCRF